MKFLPPHFTLQGNFFSVLGYGSGLRSDYCWHLGNEPSDLEEHSVRFLTFLSRLVGSWEGN